MKNFDEARNKRTERDRSFQIGGETFTYRASVAPEIMADWNAAVNGETTLGEHEWLGLYDKTILGLLEPGQEEAWARVRAVDSPLPINLSDLNDLMLWLLGEQSGRNPTQPSDSSETDGRSGTNSTDDSSLQEVEAPAS